MSAIEADRPLTHGEMVNPAYENEDHPTAPFRRKKKDIVTPEGVQPTVNHINNEELRKDTKTLRFYLRMYFYWPVLWNGCKCSLHFLYLGFMFLQIVKVVLITVEMFKFGFDRSNFSQVVNRGHLTLRHMLLEGWDASWETLPYPPAHGEFAVYDVANLQSKINYAVTRFYNAPEEAIGLYEHIPGRNMTVHMKYFDFSGFGNELPHGAVSTSGLSVRHLDFQVVVTKNDTSGLYEHYRIADDFERNNISEAIKRLLSIELRFEMNSLRVYVERERARCLNVKGKIQFMDLDNNGQVIVNLDTLTTRISCTAIGPDIPEAALESISVDVMSAVIVVVCMSILQTIFSALLAIYVCRRTKKYMNKNYKAFFQPLEETETDLPWIEYARFLKRGFWDFIVFLSDLFTFAATVGIIAETDSQWTVRRLDMFATLLSLGNILAWFSLLKFFRFHNKFDLLFATLYSAFWDVCAFLLCVAVLFLAFWACGYVVLGPYHVKFATPAKAMETLFGISNGDEIYVTMAILEADKTGGDWVLVFNRIFIIAYVSIFTIVAINLLIALFNSAYETIREHHSKKQEERDEGPFEKCLKKFLMDEESHPLRNSLYDMLTERPNSSLQENALRQELGKLIRQAKAQRDIVIFRPRKLKTIMLYDDNDDESCCLCTVKSCTCSHFGCMWSS